eukprot:732275-Rhodomonas_salina.2
MEKGLAKSNVLQDNAVRTAKEAMKCGALPVGMWIPGDKMIEEGVDGQSREGAQAVHDTAVTDQLWDMIKAKANELGMQLTVDWFASAGNARLPRFWTQFEHPDAEGDDALTAPSWGQSACVCGKQHSIDGHFFPPIPLLNHVFAKLKRDGARGVIVVPATVGEPWYSLLEEAALDKTHLRAKSGVFKQNRSRIYSSTDFEWSIVTFSFGVHHYDHGCSRWQDKGASRPSWSLQHAWQDWESHQERVTGHFRIEQPWLEARLEPGRKKLSKITWSRSRIPTLRALKPLQELLGRSLGVEVASLMIAKPVRKTPFEEANGQPLLLAPQASYGEAFHQTLAWGFQDWVIRRRHGHIAQFGCAVNPRFNIITWYMEAAGIIK